MITQFVEAAMGTAVYEKMDDGTLFGSIPDCPGVWATGPDEQACREELGEVFEEWLLLKLRDGDSLPVIGGIDLNLDKAA
ncbi:MAG: type II toxin-antitoxin system HicB family antitoxin [Armatimonadetes bacterium]|nr:type II toxin-antitoxin system HicB family antitoxin [Armatimonadota bacterium]